MNGFNFVADTNFLIDIHEGNPKVEPFLDGTAVVSVISEIELLGWYKLTDREKETLQQLLDDCIIFELTSEIRKMAIELRQQKKIKTPDAIIAATAIYLQIPIPIRGLKTFRVSN
jgi:hypothetical protein